MTAVSSEKTEVNDATSPPREPDGNEPVFEPKLPPHWALGPVHLLLVCWLGGVFVLCGHFPLRGTDLWPHVLYGEWIIDHGALPETDPFCPLAATTRVVDYAWLSQVVLAVVARVGGMEWLSHAFALTVLATYLIIARTFYLRSRSVAVTLAGLVAVFIVGFSRLSTVRPENFGALCFALLLYLIVSEQARGADGDILPETKRPFPWRLWVAVPLLIALWTNLHGSFLCGLAVLGCFGLGATVEIGGTTRSLRAVLRAPRLRIWLVTGMLALLATLVNPYGPELLRSAATFSGNENLRDLTEWQPLTLLGVGGREFALSVIVLLATLRFSRRTIPVADVLLLAVFGLGAASGVRMLGWYAVVFGFVAVPHWAEIAARLVPSTTKVRETVNPGGDMLASAILPPGRSWWISIVCLLCIWIAFAFSPLSAAALGRPGRDLQRLVGPTTPVALADYLHNNPPGGLVFAPQWWSDWLIHQGPANFRPFVTSNVHLVPSQAWRDYVCVASALADWQSVLDRYGVAAIVVDKAAQPLLAAQVRRSSAWKPVYEDALALYVVRKRA